MAASIHEPALRYLLELSADIHAAALLDDRGRLIASAPAGFGERAVELAEALVAGTRSLSPPGDETTVEADLTCEEGAVFVVCEPGRAMVCVTERTVLPGPDLPRHACGAVRPRARGGAGRSARGGRHWTAGPGVVKYPGLGRLGGYAEEVAAALRRRRDLRRPRVRVRIGHGEPRCWTRAHRRRTGCCRSPASSVADQGRPPVSG